MSHNVGRETPIMLHVKWMQLCMYYVFHCCMWALIAGQCVHTHTHLTRCTCIHTRTHAHTCVHTTHTHTHTHTHPPVVSMFGFSQRSWKPWLLSLAMDLVSLQLHGGLLRWRSKEKSEIVRRRVSLLLYLLRAPFYDRYTKSILVKLLSYLSRTLPLAKMIVDPVLAYIPVWQNTYCYNWSS